MRKPCWRKTGAVRPGGVTLGRGGWFFLVSVWLVTAIALVQPAEATTVVPLSEEALAEDAAMIVTGYVTGIQAHHDRRRDRIRTHVTIGVADVLKGDASIREIVLRQPGGSVGGVHSWIAGSPRFARGEKVLLFLREDRGRALRVAHLYQGKLSVVADATSGEEFAIQETPEEVSTVGGPQSPQIPSVSSDRTHRLRDLADRVRRHLRLSPGRKVQEGSPLILAPDVPADATLGSISSAFTFMGPARWFEADNRVPVTMRINSAGEPLAPSLGFDQVRQAMRAWSLVPGASFRYEDGGFTTVAGWQSDGVNAVSFRDPDGEMDPPVGCGGTLAIGGFYYTSETCSVSGMVFARILDGDVVFNDGWAGCNFYENFANLAEVATHELGHVLGLGHSAASDATMYAYAHFDARGATLKQDDKSGLRTIYPNPHRIGVYRGGAWYLDADGTGTWEGCGLDGCVPLGGDPTDVPLVGDWTGNGASKVGVFRAVDGTFYLDADGNGVWDGCGADVCAQIGMTGDIPLVGDWSANGTAKVGVFRPSEGTFYLDHNGNRVWDGCATDRCLQIGVDGDVPLVGDWNGTGSAKVGIFRPSHGMFYLDHNGNGAWDGCAIDRCFSIGMTGDIPLVGDWNASGATKVGVFRPSDGTFYLDYNGNGTWDGCGSDRCIPIGMTGDIPIVGDWNASGATKVGVFRPCEGRHYIDYNGSGTWEGCETDMCAPFSGDPADVPVVGSW